MFLESHEYREQKRWKKNLLEKVRKQVFLLTHECRDHKMGKNARLNLFQKDEYCDQKTMEKNRLEKLRNTYFINTRIA